MKKNILCLTVSFPEGNCSSDNILARVTGKLVLRYNDRKSAGSCSDAANSITADIYGNVNVIGKSLNGASLNDKVAIKYNLNGFLLKPVIYNY